MTNKLDLEEAKIYMKISDNSEDQLIQIILAAVEMLAKSLIPQDFATIPDDLKINMFDHAAFLYENRGNVDAELPSRILYSYKKYKNIRLF